MTTEHLKNMNGNGNGNDPQVSKQIASVTTGAEGTKVQAQVASGEQDSLNGRKFGTFNGVFRPTILTILGVMMYLREGWVVGNVGLGGAFLIILMSFVITGTAALSLSSITTNIRLGAGGVFSIISQSLGLEIGGSIGIPFYFAQGLSTAMYIYGFMEGWLYIFPDHPPYLVVVIVFVVIFISSYISTSFAFNIQIVVMFGVIFALGSIFLGIYHLPEVNKPELWSAYGRAQFWELFSVFFPAATGIMVGASMSGSLRKPRHSVPLGTLSAWAISLIVYLTLAVWYASVATPEELRNNLTIAVDRSFWGPAVLIGILSSCFTAALSSFIAAPRILQSLGAHNLLPCSGFFSRLYKGEPRNAMGFTGALVFLALLLGSLNAIAQVLTIIFLLTYLTINCVLLIEQKLNLISFRPVFHIPFWVPVCGAFFCLAAILIISPFLGLVSILVCIFIYVYLNRSKLEYPGETIRSGIFMGIANWAAKKIATKEDECLKRTWRPDLLVPVEKRTQFEGVFRLLHSLVNPQGSIQVIGLVKDKKREPLAGLKQVVHEMQEEGLYSSLATIHSEEYLSSLKTTVSVMKGSFFQPNIIFSSIEDREEADLQGIIDIAIANEMGVVLYAPHPETGFGRNRVINIWIREQSPFWRLGFNLGHIDLSLLMGYKLMGNWDVRMRIICMVKDSENEEKARVYLADLMDLSRVPPKYEIVVRQEDFFKYLDHAPRADINIFGLSTEINRAILQKMVFQIKSTCLFVYSSGRESALA